MTKDEYLKQNAIRLVQHHKQYCVGADCNIVLFGIYELLQKAGIHVTDEEFKLFH